MCIFFRDHAGVTRPLHSEHLHHCGEDLFRDICGATFLQHLALQHTGDPVLVRRQVLRVARSERPSVSVRNLNMVLFFAVVCPVLWCQVLVGNVAIVQEVVVDLLYIRHNTGGVFGVGWCIPRSAKTHNTPLPELLYPLSSECNLNLILTNTFENFSEKNFDFAFLK